MTAKEATMDKPEVRKFGAEVSKVLKLMIHSLYAHKDIFLRELISNASDACDKLRYEGLTHPDWLAGDPQLKIKISFDEAAKTLTVADNGIGMSADELAQNLGTIARSGTQEFAAHLTGDAKKDMPLIGQFGVGFYSAFMVADKVEVVSTRAGSDTSHRWESNGEGEYTIASCDKAPRGTSITLHLKSGEEEYLDPFRLKHVVETYSDHIGFPIEMAQDEGEPEVLNKGSALWTRSKSDITPEQYREFYRHVAHTPEEPWLTLHNKAEGKIEYTSLLFVPGIKPFDLFHPDRQRRVKLYIKRVFITDQNVDLIPAYLRFLRGVVDSEDLPLNISRETLQDSPMLAKIRESLTKKLLAELKKKAEADAADYQKFWDNFGPVMKEGLCEAGAPKEQILEVCRFASTHGEGVVSLADYISRMKPEQKHIYYLTGDDAALMRNSPKLEGFVKRGVEVLLMSDHVDDFWLTVVHEFQGKEFKSITRADIDLSALGDLPEEDGKKQEAPAQDTVDSLLTRFRDVLGKNVRDVRTTTKLTDSPACLAVEEGEMDIRLQRFLVEQKQLATSSAKILEINASHPILRSLASKLADEGAKEEVGEIIWLLLDQARVAEGEPVSDPAAFLRRVNRFVQKSLVA